MPSIPSKKELDETKGGDFALIPHEEYKLKVVELEKKNQLKYGSEDEYEDVVNVTLEVAGFKSSAEEPKDEDDNSALGRKLWFYARPHSMGFQQDGTPSKTRCLVYYGLGEKDIKKGFDFEWTDLKGKIVYAEVAQKTNKKGNEVNFISRFVLPPKK